MHVMYDSIEVDQIPASAGAVAGYVGGKWPTFAELERRFPHAHRLSLAIAFLEDAEGLDIENGDANPPEAPEWTRRQHVRGEPRPVLYANLSTMPAVLAALGAAGIRRSEYRLIVAHYTGVAHVCGPHDGLAVDADGTQWTDKALGRNLDESLLVSSFFDHAPAPYRPADEARWEASYDRLRGRKGVAAAGRRRALVRAMTRRRRLIWHLANAEAGGWNELNRAQRYRALLVRTEG